MAGSMVAIMTAGPCVSLPRFASREEKGQVSGRLGGQRRSLAGSLLNWAGSPQPFGVVFKTVSAVHGHSGSCLVAWVVRILCTPSRARLRRARLGAASQAVEAGPRSNRRERAAREPPAYRRAAWGLAPCGGGAASPLPAGADPAGAAAAPASARPAPVLQRCSAPRCWWPAQAQSWQPSSSRLASCRRAKITVQGRSLRSRR